MISQYSSWLGTLLLHYAICRVLCKELDTFNSQLKQSLITKDIYRNRDLNLFWQWHLQLGSVVEKADSFLGPYMAIVLFSSAINLCFGLYLLIWNPETATNIFSLVTGLYWFLLTILIVLIVCITAALVNNTVRVRLL